MSVNLVEDLAVRQVDLLQVWSEPLVFFAGESGKNPVLAA
jgi:hypothetical protein